MFEYYLEGFTASFVVYVRSSIILYHTIPQVATSWFYIGLLYDTFTRSTQVVTKLQICNPFRGYITSSSSFSLV